MRRLLQQNVTTTIYFTFPGTSPNTLVTGNALFSAITKQGDVGAQANTINSVSTVGGGYSLVLDSTELSNLGDLILYLVTSDFAQTLTIPFQVVSFDPTGPNYGGGGGGDPWATALPGAYSAGEAGWIVGNALDATISSRSTYAGGAIASVTGNVGGNVVGSVASVTGNVGGNVVGSVASVVGNVGGNVAGSVASVVGDVGGNVVGNVGGNVAGSVASVSGNVGGNVVGSVASVSGNVGGNVVGSVGSVTAGVTVATNTDKTGYSLSQAFPSNFATLSIDTNGRAKIQSSTIRNSALNGFGFIMYSSVDHLTPVSGLSVTAQRSIDGGAFAACSNAAVSIGDGAYSINLTASDLNGGVIVLVFTAVGADPTFAEILTTP